MIRELDEPQESIWRKMKKKQKVQIFDLSILQVRSVRNEKSHHHSFRHIVYFVMKSC